MVSASSADGNPGAALGDIRVAVDWGSFNLDLPAFHFLTRNAYSTGAVVSTQANFSGVVDGQRLQGVLEKDLFELRGTGVSAALKASYAKAHGQETTGCTPDDVDTFCYWPVIVDDPGRGDGNYSFFSAEPLRSVTDRTAAVWQLAFELVAAPAGGEDVQFKGGVDFRLADLDTSLSGECVNCQPDGVSLAYDEKLETTYVGAYFGLRSQVGLWTDAALIVDGQVGLYDVNARYTGHEVQTYPGYPDDIYDLTLSRGHFATIGSVKLDLRQKFGRFSLSVFDAFEWHSWAPRMQYNNNDDAPVDPWAGTQVGTEISDGDAWSNTVGVRLILTLD